MSSLVMFYEGIAELKESPKKKNMPTKDERNNFSIAIENMVSQLEISYIEAITHHCEKSGLEVEVAATLLNDSLKEKIRDEAQQLRYLPRSSKLPF